MAKEILKPEQFTRLQQISWQNGVLGALTNRRRSPEEAQH